MISSPWGEREKGHNLGGVEVIGNTPLFCGLFVVRQYGAWEGCSVEDIIQNITAAPPPSLADVSPSHRRK